MPDTLETSPNEDERGSSSSSEQYFHCYLLRSQDPKHPHKTYVGFTVNPHRRIRQHNGLLKYGGARKTKRAGRPWEFAVIVHGFPTQTMALQFEWAWQHCDRSLAVRGAIGDDVARKLKRKRGLRGQLEILKTMLSQCPGLYSSSSSNHKTSNTLRLFFFDGSVQSMYDGIKVLPLVEEAPPIERDVVALLEDMPFYQTRSRPSRKRGKALTSPPQEDGAYSINHEPQTLENNVNCIWCRRGVAQEELLTCFLCWNCQGCFHELCASVHFGHGSKKCPRCSSTIENYASNDSDFSGHEQAGLEAAPANDSSCTDCDDEDSVVSLASEHCRSRCPIEKAASESSEQSKLCSHPPIYPTIAGTANYYVSFTSSDEDIESIGDSRVLSPIGPSKKSFGMSFLSPSPQGSSNNMALRDGPSQADVASESSKIPGHEFNFSLREFIMHQYDLFPAAMRQPTGHQQFAER